MRDLTSTELNDYFRFSARGFSGSPPDGFTHEQAKLIGTFVAEYEVLEAFLPKALDFFIETEEASPRDIFLSLFVTAFQMGRECESRLLTLALKGDR